MVTAQRKGYMTDMTSQDNATLKKGSTTNPDTRMPFVAKTLMPLMNTPFAPGRCQEAIEGMEVGPRQDIARAEYYYFSGQPELALATAAPYLDSQDVTACLSACLICAYSNLHLGQAREAKALLDQMNAILIKAGERSPQLGAASAFISATAAVLLHLPLPEELPATDELLPLLPQGLRAFALYVQAHLLYLKGEYAHSAGIVEATLPMGADAYPIPAIYLHLVAVMDYMSLKDVEKARGHLLAAWELAQPDDLIEAFGEHHGLLGGMLESVIKPGWPDDFRRIIDITYRFSAGWRRVHNPVTGDEVADDLTTTEFATAMLAARSWTNQEIADHLGVSINTVKRHLARAMEKLGVTSRKNLSRYMLL